MEKMKLNLAQQDLEDIVQLLSAVAVPYIH